MFPFGEQNCKFWLIFKDEKDDQAKVILNKLDGELSDAVHNMTSNGDYRVSLIKNTVHYSGKRFGIEVCIHFKSQYSYYLFNNYLPSLLIFFIAYSTLYFPLTNFNERVMVSLTSQLVLATFFTQASDSTVHTPYVKMLDAWFAALIAFSFIIVVINVAIHRIFSSFGKVDVFHKSERNETWPEVNSKARKYNYRAKIWIAVAFALSFLSYSVFALY